MPGEGKWLPAGRVWARCERRGKGERRSVRIHKRLLYCVKVNLTSLDHLLLGKCADVDSVRRLKNLSHAVSITPRF